MRWSAVVVAASAAGPWAGCGGGVTVTVDGDREVPAQLDAICLGVADHDPGGGSFGRTYRLIDRVDHLPQTLAVEPGGADRALAWVRGYRGGVPVAAARADLDFGGDVTLRLDRCPAGRAGTLALADQGPTGGTKAVASLGQGGAVVVVLGDGAADAIDAGDGHLFGDAVAGGTGGVAIVAFDADGDCDDDLAIARAGGPVDVVRREGRSFALLGSLSTTAAALAAADVDYDGDVDSITAGAAQVTLWRNSGAGDFVADAAAIDTRGMVTAARALAAGDLDGDGHTDVLVGQGGAPPLALLGDPSGGGALTGAPAVFPPVGLDVAAITLADVDGDLDLDAVLAIAGGPARVYVNRGGLLEDQSFLRLPQPAPVARDAAIIDWDGDCMPDAVLAGPASTSLRGGAGGVFTDGQGLDDAEAAVVTDLDDDGAADLLLVGSAGVRWFRR